MDPPATARCFTVLVVVLVALLGAAAANVAIADGRSDAALSLLETARQSLSAGQAEQAAVLIERALRIDPRNPTLWHYLGLARRELGDTAQADAMAAKSRSLAGGEPGLRARNPARPSDSASAFDDEAAPRVYARSSTRSEPAATSDYCEVWTFDERGRRQSWTMKCDDARRYAAPGGSALMIRTRAATERRQLRSNATQQ